MYRQVSETELLQVLESLKTLRAGDTTSERRIRKFEDSLKTVYVTRECQLGSGDWALGRQTDTYETIATREDLSIDNGHPEGSFYTQGGEIGDVLVAFDVAL